MHSIQATDAWYEELKNLPFKSRKYTFDQWLTDL